MKKTKIKVRREGRDGIYLVDKKEIKRFIIKAGFKKIHNLSQTLTGANIITGANYSVRDVLKDIDKADSVAVLTGGARKNNLNHSLSVIVGGGLEMFDIGEITDDDLLILN